MKESELLSFAHTCLKQSGLVFWRVPNGAVMHSIGGRVIRKCSPIKGFPDLAGVFPSGRFWAVELKTDKGRLSPEQTEWITKLNMSGAMALVLRSKDEIREFVAAAVQMKSPQSRE
jgi:hypothetical protein